MESHSWGKGRQIAPQIASKRRTKPECLDEVEGKKRKRWLEVYLPKASSCCCGESHQRMQMCCKVAAPNCLGVERSDKGSAFMQTHQSYSKLLGLRILGKPTYSHE
eukprot:1408783-Amphidinium_carterae.1